MSNQAALLLLKGMISDATQEEQAEVRELADEIKALAKSKGDLSRVSMSLATLELAVEND